MERIHDSARSRASRCHHLTAKHLITPQPIISAIPMSFYVLIKESLHYIAVHVRGAHMAVLAWQGYYETLNCIVDHHMVF